MSAEIHSLLSPQTHNKPGFRYDWGGLYGSALGLALQQVAKSKRGFLLVITPDSQSANRVTEELSFYRNEEEIAILNFPSWETLPYDRFSPHQDIISERIQTLYRLPRLKQGILVVPIATLMQRLPPRSFIESNTLICKVGDQLNLETMRASLEQYGYQCVSQVMEHGEFAVRGSLLDLYPSGSKVPYRIELFDDEIESIREFDPESQRSSHKIDLIEMLPAREFPLNKDDISLFRQNFREQFSGAAQDNPIYRDVSQGVPPAGIEFYLPLFFSGCESLFDYLPEDLQLFTVNSIDLAADQFIKEVNDRHEMARFHKDRPPLPPHSLYLAIDELFGALKRYPRHQIQSFKLEEGKGLYNYASTSLPQVTLDAHLESPLHNLQQFIAGFSGRTLFVSESAGRREAMLQTLKQAEITPSPFDNWAQFLHSSTRFGITTAQLENGLYLQDPPLAVISDPQLYGNQVMQRRRRKRRHRDQDAVIRNLAELQIGNAVVHEDHGVGRYLGLQTLTVGELINEFLALEYAGGDKLYVPVSSLDLISLYTGSSPEKTPLHRLGSGQWEKAKRKAKEKIHDVAAELLEIYAKRAAKEGYRYQLSEDQYLQFSGEFPFEETPDQEGAIADVVQDMTSSRPMDRLICGDVGFGKTEVAMRAAFLAVMDGKQVAVLVPTTLLSEQHLQNFRDRFASWPIQIESLSRFRSKKEQDEVITNLESGKVDIVIGTHKLIQPGIKYRDLGLVIIDEEHRFGVRQKDKFKALRAEVDLLTLTATPIPRTLNMALGGMRELSIIASPPAKRLAIKTFVHEWDKDLIKEASLREIKRGGQLYFLHNDVATIDKIARELQELIPEASVAIAHGQMRERDLEQVMSDFYHQRYNILVCSTIIETGIDIPTANTIIMNRADKLGLAQLYQLRGRVGRSHHRAYAYLLIPSQKGLSGDARKRLEAIESIETLGTGFTLASHDLEIRGAGELLGDEQSGQMQEIGFSLYSDLLERAVKALKEGKSVDDAPAAHASVEIELGVPALIPDDYIPDVHSRLLLYKRISAAEDSLELQDLQVEMIDRFGLLPDATKTLFALMEIKEPANRLGITRLEFGSEFGRITFVEQPPIDPMKIIALIQQQPLRYQLDSKQRLKIVQPMPDSDRRQQVILQLIKTLEE